MSGSMRRVIAFLSRVICGPRCPLRRLTAASYRPRGKTSLAGLALANSSVVHSKVWVRGNAAIDPLVFRPARRYHFPSHIFTSLSLAFLKLMMRILCAANRGETHDMQTAFHQPQGRVAALAAILPGVLPYHGAFPFKRFDSRKIDTVHGDVFSGALVSSSHW